MKKITAAILAHVDSGKTTLSEGMLYLSGEIRKLGRVDHRDAFLDTNSIERERGITIFSHQAVMSFSGTEITLLDTPGHVDFSAEAERTLNVADYAILVISATDKVQSHTETLWGLLKKYNIPTFIFVNKMDLEGTDKRSIINDLKLRLDNCCVDFSDKTKSEEFFENAAMCDEILMEEYLENNELTDNAIADAILKRNLFPCFFGSALKLSGVESFLDGFVRFTKECEYGNEFGAKVFKISEDNRGRRLTHLKITGGKLSVKDLLKTGDTEEKVNEIRIYSGDNYTNVQKALQGTVCAVTGPQKTYAGEGLGTENHSRELILEPVFTYRVILPEGTDKHKALFDFRKLQEEETQLNVVWNERQREISIELMGEIQLEVLRRIISERFNMDVGFEEGSIIYKETIEDKIEGVGHYEPLRHYAEVHLLLEPLKRGKGLEFRCDCSEDLLDRNWQRLILTHLKEKTHLGVLTGSPITDMRITLKSGRAHLKHTEGGDFRQATYRAVRHGLMCVKSILLEPYYDFRLEIPTNSVGRAITDINQMGGNFSPPEVMDSETSVISGYAPIRKMYGYHKEVISYTKGRGRLILTLKGYGECSDSEEIIKEIAYNPEADIENTPDSVFCAHGAGYTVKWNEVTEHMHLESVIKPQIKELEIRNTITHPRIDVSDEELLRIFEKTYGKVQRKSVNSPLRTYKDKEVKYRAKTMPKGKEYLLIDGYNIIFAWDDLRETAAVSLETARDELISRMSSYQIMKNTEVIVVFDAYKVKGNIGEIEKVNNITVVYTKEAETADAYIERATHQLSKNNRVKVATSDSLEQLIILGHGALRISANEFLTEVTAVEDEIREFIKNYNQNADIPHL